jgi:hypothetical protein
MPSRYSNVSTMYLTSKEFWDWRTVTEPSQISLGEILNSSIFEVRSNTLFVLPGIFSRNLIFKFLGAGGFWEVVPTGGRRIWFGRTSTGGGIKASTLTDSMEIVSMESGDWKVSNSVGNLEVA